MKSVLPLFLLPLLLHAEDRPLTYHRDVAPIIYANCTTCHRPGESAPFPFTNYDEVSRRARTIDRVVTKRYMPPWHANTELTEFLDVRRLSDEEISVINRWVEGGKLEGDPADASALPSFTEGWQLGEPDLIVSMTEPYPVPAEGPDIYRNFVIPLDLPKDKWVKAVELRPSARRVVHHSLIFLDDSGSARKRDGKDGKPGFSGMNFRRSGDLGGYVPGATPRMLPFDLARSLPRGADLILSTHFHLSGKAEEEQTVVGLYFTDTPPSRKLEEIQVPPEFGRKAGIDIPPGEANFTIEEIYKIPVDVEAYFISGHAHYLCRSMRMTATLPDQSEQVLLDIPNWDINWQDTYYFAAPIPLPAGTILKSTIIYDNSSDNPRNPSNPPVRVKWGLQSTDEMGSITLYGVATGSKTPAPTNLSNVTDQAKLLAQLGERLKQAGILARLPSLMKSLDLNGDGILQESELPEAARAALLSNFDLNRDRALDPTELKSLRDWLVSLREDKTL